MASELGADIVKLNFPQTEQATGVREKYAKSITPQDAMSQVVRSAGRSLVLVSGGGMADDDVLYDKAHMSMDAGATGLIFERNVWQPDYDDSLRFVARKTAGRLPKPTVDRPPEPRPSPTPSSNRASAWRCQARYGIVCMSVHRRGFKRG